MSETENKSLSEILREVFNPELETTTIGSLVKTLDHHGLAVILIIFSIPAALPIPAAGYSTLLSIPLMLIGVRMLLGYDTLWLPQKIEEKTYNPKSFSGALEKMLKLVTKIEKLTKPRFDFFVNSRVSRTIIASLICLMAASMALPIPGTNTLPAGGIFLIGFGLLEGDGLLILVGKLYSLAAISITAAIIFFGYEATKQLISGFLG